MRLRLNSYSSHKDPYTYHTAAGEQSAWSVPLPMRGLPPEQNAGDDDERNRSREDDSSVGSGMDLSRMNSPIAVPACPAGGGVAPRSPAP